MIYGLEGTTEGENSDQHNDKVRPDLLEALDDHADGWTHETHRAQHEQKAEPEEEGGPREQFPVPIPGRPELILWQEH